MAAPNVEKKATKRLEERDDIILVRISGYDIPGDKKLYPGLTRIKGVGWSVSNALCIKLDLPKDKVISDLSKSEIEKIEKFLKNPEMNAFLMNRRNDLETGETKHYVAVDLEMRKDFDVRRLKKIRSYKGVRHTSGLPVRGQRTRAHFRKKGQAVSVSRKKK